MAFALRLTFLSSFHNYRPTQVTFSPAPTHYSYRNAIIGSTRIARLAGIRHASSATPTSSDISPNVTGSVTLTLYSRLEIKRVTAKALDNYIGFVSTDTSLSVLKTYLNGITRRS
jgi:hypothetical protein